MRTGLTTLQQNIIDATVKKISWLVEIDQDNDGVVDYTWSTHAKTWGEIDYDPKIMEMSPLSVTLATPELSVIPPTKATLKVSFPGSQIDGLHASDFEGAAVTIRLIGEITAGAAELMAWRFVVVFAASTVQILTLGLQDRFTKMLEGDYPNGPLISELFPADIMKNDNACDPVPFGNPFYPVRWIKKSLTATYVDADTFTVAGDKTALFSAGQFLLANCGVDGQKGCWVASSLLDKCLLIARNGTDSPGASQLITLEIGATYRVKGCVKQKEEATVKIALGATGHTYEASTSWELKTFDHVATTTSAYIILQVITTHLTDGAYFDTISVQKVVGETLGPNLITNGTFDTDTNGWAAYLSGSLSAVPGGVDNLTTVNLTAASADLTVNLAKVQTDHYYLGLASHVYTIDRARTPREVNFKTTYLATDYNFKQDTIEGSDGNSYKVVQAVICDGNKDGVNDANGFWGVAEKLVHDMPLRVSRDDTASITDPALIAKWIFLDWGIPIGEIDDVSRAAATAIFAARGLTLNLALWQRQSREKIISKLFAMVNMVPLYRDAIGFKVLSAASVKTITEAMIKPGSFQSGGTYTQKEKDSGYVTWQIATEPADSVNKSLIAAKDTTARPSDTTIEAEWVLDSVKAQKGGKLALQRILLKDKIITFVGNSCLLPLEPGDMVTITGQNHGDEGGGYKALITKMTMREGCWIGFECLRFTEELDTWDGLDPGALTVDGAAMEQQNTPLYQGPANAAAAAGEKNGNTIYKTLMIGDGGTLATNEDPATNGGFLATNTELTCYNEAGEIMLQAKYGGPDQGDAQFGDYGGGHGIKWDQGDETLTIKVDSAGGVTVSGGGDITLIGSDTDPGKIKFQGTSYSVEMGGDTDGNRFVVKPNTNNVIDFRISDPIWWSGEDLRFRDLYFYGTRQGGLVFGGFTGAVNGMALEFDADTGDAYPRFEVSLYDKTAEHMHQYNFRYEHFGPLEHKIQDLGEPAAAWDDAYADDFNNVADFFHLDHRKEGQVLVPVDDLEIIRNIKPNGIFDERTGFGIIDDRTLPEWLLTKHKKTGEILKDPQGKPYLSLKTVISLCLGAIRQLEEKIESGRNRE